MKLRFPDIAKDKNGDDSLGELGLNYNNPPKVRFFDILKAENRNRRCPD